MHIADIAAGAGLNEDEAKGDSANEIAEQLGDKRMANMVLLGAYLALVPLFTLEQVGASLERHIPSHRRNLLAANREALHRGAQAAQEAPVVQMV